MRISDWSSDVCSSDLRRTAAGTGDQAGARAAQQVVRDARIGDRVAHRHIGVRRRVAHEALELAVYLLAQVDLRLARDLAAQAQLGVLGDKADAGLQRARSEEHTSELQSLMRISYAVFCLK